MHPGSPGSRAPHPTPSHTSRRVSDPTPKATHPTHRHRALLFRFGEATYEGRALWLDQGVLKATPHQVEIARMNRVHERRQATAMGSMVGKGHRLAQDLAGMTSFDAEVRVNEHALNRGYGKVRAPSVDG